MANKANRRNSLYGYPNPQAFQFPDPIVQVRAPTTRDQGVVGQLWVNTVAQTSYILCAVVGGAFQWVTSPSGGTSATSFTVNPGNLTVTAGNIIVSAGDVTAAGVGTFGTLAAGNSVITGTLDVTGASTFTDAAFTGNVTVTGDFDITDTASISLTSTNDAAGAITLLANGGTSETILIQSAQGTSASSINLNSVAGGITLTGALASADAINIVASNAAGGIDVDYGTGGMTITGANGAFAVATGTGAISISADAAATTVNIGTGAAVVKTINVGGTGANVIAIGNTQTAGSVAIGTAMTSGTISIGGTGLQTGTVSIAPGTGAQTVNIATGGTGIKTVHIADGAIDNVVTIGSLTGAASLALQAGTAGLTGDSTGAISLDAAAASNFSVSGAGIDLSLVSAAGRVVVNGEEAAADAVRILSAAGGLDANVALQMNLDSSQAAAADSVRIVASAADGGMDIDAGTGGITIDSTGAISIDAAAASNMTVTGAGMDLTLSSSGGSVVVTASEASASAVTIQASNAAGGVIIDANGLVAVDPAVDTQASPSAASTLNFRVLRVIFTGFTTAMGASQAFTITSNQILVTSGIFVQVASLDASTNGAIMTLDGVVQAAGSIVVNTTNNGAGALGAGDNVLITVWIIS